jgi:hypothetical protein
VRAVSSHAVGNGWDPRVVVGPVQRGCCNTSSPLPRAAAPTPCCRERACVITVVDPDAARRALLAGLLTCPEPGCDGGPSGLVTSAHPAGPSPRRCADRAASRSGPLPALRGDPGAAAGVVCAPARLRRRGRRRGPAGRGCRRRVPAGSLPASMRQRARCGRAWPLRAGAARLSAVREHYHNTARYCQAHSRQALVPAPTRPLFGSLAACAARGGDPIACATAALNQWTKPGSAAQRPRSIPSNILRSRSLSTRHLPAFRLASSFRDTQLGRHHRQRPTRTTASWTPAITASR